MSKKIDFGPIAARLVEMSFAAADAEQIVRDCFAVYRGHQLGLDLRFERREEARRKTQAYVNTLRRRRVSAAPQENQP